MTITFDQFNASLLYKRFNLLQQKSYCTDPENHIAISYFFLSETNKQQRSTTHSVIVQFYIFKHL